jgi:PhoPQ-activated pathogenicity-related protein
VSGASKRGWTSQLIAATECETCSKVIAMMPVVPIVPDVILDVHRQWKSYNGFTFAFEPYLAVGIMEEFDGPDMTNAFQIMDPINYLDRINKIPKYILVSSDDEFMSMDWTNIYWDKLGGEKHLSILPNTEHSMSTGMYEAVSLISTWTRSIAASKTDRPTFDF